MKFVTFKIAAKSLLFYRKTSVNQIIIILLLAAVITGSLFTGFSVRNSLKQKANEKLGNTDVLISSGLRFFDSSLARRIAGRLDETAAAILETDGYIQNFITGATALNSKIYGISNDFFPFHGVDSITIDSGTVAINEHLAQQLKISQGDEIILNFRDLDPLPANAPFAPSRDKDGQKVMKVSKILRPEQSGNFSLGFNQIVPMNVFADIRDLKSDTGKVTVTNRLLIHNTHNYHDSLFFRLLSEILTINDIGLTIRTSAKTGEPELISDRIFIDSAIVSNVLRLVPPARPLITYLANSIGHYGRTTPYSFVTAISPSDLEIKVDEIVISDWLAKDIGATAGDTLKLTWFDPGTGKLLEEKSGDFLVAGVLDQKSRLSDPSLMPDFPGISGSTTCSGWDAGVPILLDKIRDKDEDYWNQFRGTPKAFLSYTTGLKLWGNNFGPATAIRFPDSMNPDQINKILTGSIDPAITGFTVSDIRNESKDAATSGVDFSSLFLGLGIFIILACIILLSFAVSIFFDSRKEQVKTYHALGFKNSFIRKVFFLETLFQSFTGAIPGVFMGFFINVQIINALNSVWRGAVQTDTLAPQFGILPLVSGFVITIVISCVILLIKIRSFLKDLKNPVTGELHLQRERRNFIFLLLSLLAASVLLVSSFILKNSSTILSFIAGSIFFVTIILAIRQFYIRPVQVAENDSNKRLKNLYSRKFYAFYPSQVITPVIFIAAGIFAVMITGANRQVLNKKMLLPSGGTGGYLLWAETAVPVNANLNLTAGRFEFGLDEPELKDLKFVQAGKLNGDDASCLNLNHVTSPPLLGVDPQEFITKGSFSFAAVIKSEKDKNPWSLLVENPGPGEIYGIADQTVLQWGLKLKTGDTLKYRAENGQPLNIIISGGLKSSVFQGHLIISEKNLKKFYPSVSGSSVFLINGKPELSDYYRDILSERLSGYGASVETTGEKLASFFEVTNTYLDVFTILGAFGMVLGIAGMGFILIRNYNQRKNEFALMMATGYSLKKIRRLLLEDQIIILLCGVLTGCLSGLISTLPTLLNGSEIPWRIIIFMVISVTGVGLTALLLSVRMIKTRSLVIQLRKE